MKSLNGVMVSDVLMNWPLTPPVDIEPIPTGTNNRSFLVKAGSRKYVLKAYQNTGMQGRLRFEQELLVALATADLPFAVPSCLRAISGDVIVQTSHDSTVTRFALFHHIPGRAARFGSLTDAIRCGEALADLHLAMGAVRLNPAMPVPETYGDLCTVHDAVPEPFFAVRLVFRDRAVGMDMATSMARTEARWQRSTSGWSSQIIHGDFYPSNTLIDEGKVSGIVDFEFSGMGYRPMDFAIGLAAFSTRDWDDDCSWPLVDAFATAYLRRMPLSPDELGATPVLLLMREVTSFIHRLGRQAEGLTTVDDMHDRARQLLSLDRWLAVHQVDLVNRLSRISAKGVLT